MPHLPMQRMHRPLEGVCAGAEPACTYYNVYVVAGIYFEDYIASLCIAKWIFQTERLPLHL